MDIVDIKGFDATATLSILPGRRARTYNYWLFLCGRYLEQWYAHLSNSGRSNISIYHAPRTCLVWDVGPISRTGALSPFFSGVRTYHWWRQASSRPHAGCLVAIEIGMVDTVEEIVDAQLWDAWRQAYSPTPASRIVCSAHKVCRLSSKKSPMVALLLSFPCGPIWAYEHKRGSNASIWCRWLQDLAITSLNESTVANIISTIEYSKKVGDNVKAMGQAYAELLSRVSNIIDIGFGSHKHLVDRSRLRNSGKTASASAHKWWGSWQRPQ